MADETEFRKARDFFSVLPQDHVVIWNDSPRMQAIDRRFIDLGLSPLEQGKGKNVWTAMGYLISCADTAVMAIHDCDILTYKRDLLARLVYPVAHPGFSYQLSKGFYARVGNGKLNGRVSRLLVSPLLIALKKVLGDHDYIDYLRAFRYPLSGEVALRTAMLPDLRIPSDWGLEIGVLSEAWRNLGRHATCQVEIADAYDHKHQPVSPEDAQSGLNRMSTDICKAIFRKMATEGTVFTHNTFRTLKATYSVTEQAGVVGTGVPQAALDQVSQNEVPLPRLIGGVVNETPGWRTIRFQPLLNCPDCTWAQTAVPTPYGLIQTRWARADRVATVELHLPEGVEADVHLPGAKESMSAGSRRWRIEISTNDITTTDG